MEPTTSLEDYRERKARAQQFHPSQWQPVWTPQDAVATAQAFHAELANAERGIPDKPHWTAKLFGRSRFRRAKVYDGLAVTLLLALMAALGVVAWAASAHADSDRDAVVWTAHYGRQVCAAIDTDATINGLLNTASALQARGFTEDQAGQILGLAIVDICPHHLDLLARFIVRDQPGRIA